MKRIFDISILSLDVYRRLEKSDLRRQIHNPIPIATALEELGLEDNHSHRLAVGRAFRQLGFEMVRMQRQKPSKKGDPRTKYGFLHKETLQLARELMRPLHPRDDCDELTDDGLTSLQKFNVV